jgi:integrase
MAGRKRTGTLVWTGKAFSVRFANGPLIPLHTDDKRIAQARRRALANDPSAGAPTSAVETFEEAARRHVAVQLEAGVPSAPARKSRLERWAFPIIGKLLVTAVRPGHITSVLEHVASLGKSSTTLAHMRGDMIYVFGRLLKEEVVTRNPARGDLVDTPPGVDDERKRTILRDDEFAALVEAPTTPPQLRMMAIVSRAFGGMRTSDLRAWNWQHVDLPPGGAWEWADVPRPKTAKRGGAKRGPRGASHALERLALPPAVAAELATWWLAQGRPSEGPVFTFPPSRKSFAADLRAALLAAGIDRHELHHDTERTRRVDFHSFRRAYVTAIARAGLNAQTAMKAAGHRQMSTHMLYAVPELIEVPAAALPTWGHRAPAARPRAPLALPPAPADDTPPGVRAGANRQPTCFNYPPGVPPGVYIKRAKSLSCEEEDSNLHGSYPASTSIQFDRSWNGTLVHLDGTQPPEPTAFIEPNQSAFAPGRDESGQKIVDLKLSIPDHRGKNADRVLRAYLRARADALCGAAGWLGVEWGAVQ